MTMREIKFRYHYLTEGAGADAAFGREIDGILFENGAVSEVLIDGDPWPVAKDEHGECGALCQYTGLKDRNGKEIYEGDILTLRKHSDGKAEVVTMVGGSWMAGRWGLLADAIHYADSFGNIHENPDLLDG